MPIRNQFDRAAPTLTPSWTLRHASWFGEGGGRGVRGRRPGVERVEASPVVQTATLVLDPARSFLADLRRHLEECGLHCAAQSVPHHICGPLTEPTRRKATVTVTMRLSTRTC